MPLEKLIRQVASLSSDGIFIAEADFSNPAPPRVIWCNDAVCAQSGFARDELIGGGLDQLCQGLVAGDTDIGGAGFDGVLDLMRQGGAIRERCRIRRKDGSPYWVRLSLQPAETQGGEGAYWIGFQHDLSDIETLRRTLASAERQTEISKQRLWDAIEALPDAFVMYDSDDRLVVCNSRYKEFYAASAKAIFPGAAYEDIMRYGLRNGQYPEAKGVEEAWLSERLDRRIRTSKPFTRELPGDTHFVIHDIETRNGDVVGLRTDVTELRRQEKALERLSRELFSAKELAEIASRTDPLTGVGNRRGLEAYMAGLATGTGAGPEIGLLHVDLDRFKAINDRFGHAAGDRVLCAVGTILKTQTRAEDFVARVGGDEFVIVVPTGKAQAAVGSIAERVIAACGDGVEFEGKHLEFGVSIGIAIADQKGIYGLLDAADVALYSAKATGRGRYIWAQGSCHTGPERRGLHGRNILRGN